MSSTGSNLKQSTIKGGLWGSGSRFARLICQFASIIVLARLIPPEDFGIVATVASIVTVINLLRELGLAHAIVQRKEVTDDELSGLFRVTVILGLILFLLSVLLGLFATWLFNSWILAKIAPFFGFAALLSSIEVIPLGLLRRKLAFSKIAIREVLAAVLGTIAAIVMAFVGFGVWALVTAPVVMQVTNTVFSWMAISWRPKGPGLRIKELGSYLKFGGTITLGEFTDFLCRNLDRFLIGKIWGFDELGFYTRGHAVMVGPVDQLSAPINSTLLPILSRMKEEPDRRRRWVETIYLGMVTVGGLAAAWILANSASIVGVLLGEGWERVGEVLFWLSPFVLVRPGGGVLYSLLMSEGNLRDLLKWTAWGSAATISAILITIPFGMVAVTIGISSALAIRVLLATHYVGKEGLADSGRLRGSFFRGLVGYIGWGYSLMMLNKWLGSVDVPGWVQMGVTGLLTACVLGLLVALSPFWKKLTGQLLTAVLGKLSRKRNA